MTNFIQPKSNIFLNLEKYHNNSPKLWINIIIVSLLIHLGILTTLIRLINQNQPFNKTENIEVPIDIITVTGQEDQPQTSSLSSEKLDEIVTKNKLLEEQLSTVQDTPEVINPNTTRENPSKPSPIARENQPEETRRNTPQPSPIARENQPEETRRNTPQPSPIATENQPEETRVNTPQPSPIARENQPEETRVNTPQPSPIATENQPEETRVNTPQPSPIARENQPEETRVNTPQPSPIARENQPEETRRNTPQPNPITRENQPEETRVNTPQPSPIAKVPSSVTPTPITTETETALKPSSTIGLIARIQSLKIVYPERDVPTKIAQSSQENQTLSNIDYLTSQGINIDSEIAIEVVVIIQSNGKAMLVSDTDLTKVLRGNLNIQQAEQLATEIIKKWRFEPTYMGNQPVDRDYFLQIQLSPIQN
jgi:hypothetical protein